MSRRPSPGDDGIVEKLIVLAQGGGAKVRTGVVLRIGYRVAVACATSVDKTHLDPCVAVTRDSRNGIALGLLADSYFTAPVDFLATESVWSKFEVPRQCPDRLYFELLQLLQQGHSKRK